MLWASLQVRLKSLIAIGLLTTVNVLYKEEILLLLLYTGKCSARSSLSMSISS